MKGVYLIIRRFTVLLIIFLYIIGQKNTGSAFYPKSFSEKNFAQISRQHTNWDCGLASLQTLFNYTNFTADNEITLKAKEDNITLNDLQIYLARLGLASNGYYLNWAHLKHYFTNGNPTPLLIHLKHPSNHFTVMLGIVKGQTVLADPSIGLEVLPKKVFLQQWSGYVLHLEEISPNELANNHLTGIANRINLLWTASW